MTRWIKFNLVGVLGALVQIAVVWGAVYLADFHYLFATFLAVEVAIVHNFLWHALWTFSDRNQPIRRNGSLKKSTHSFFKFQLTAGAISILGNMAIMMFLVGHVGMRPVLANCLAIGICSIANFIAADRFSFRHSEAPRTRGCSRS